jgi:hypothetical protein
VNVKVKSSSSEDENGQSRADVDLGDCYSRRLEEKEQ